MSHGHFGGGTDTPPPPDSPVERLVAPVAKAGAAVAALGVLLVLAITGYSVFNRYVLGTPVTWTDELSGFLVVAIVMFGAAETLRRGEHISVDLISARAGPLLSRILGLWGMVAVILLMAALLISAIIAVRFSWDFDMYSEGYLAVQMWVPQTALIVGSVTVILVALARLISLLQRR
ncbi:TRAP transporter small permease [Minwuia sp.]|uniref:TRAP transporter small permease n=1 Tax=Minwuia sp. TaxID=2493630 RepID=UPI003A941745